MAQRPRLVLFDVIETLFSLTPVETRLRELGLGDRPLDIWFPAFLRDGFALAASGSYQPFRAVAENSLRAVVLRRGRHLDAAEMDVVLDAFSALDPYPDVAPALQRLADAGIRAMTLSNGATSSTAALLTRSGLIDLVEAVLSVDAVRAWKPRSEPYLHACATAGVGTERAALVAVHAWDVHGARTAGLLGGWCSRLEGSYSDDLFASPTVRGDTLVDVVEALLALPA